MTMAQPPPVTRPRLPFLALLPLLLVLLLAAGLLFALHTMKEAEKSLPVEALSRLRQVNFIEEQLFQLAIALRTYSERQTEENLDSLHLALERADYAVTMIHQEEVLSSPRNGDLFPASLRDMDLFFSELARSLAARPGARISTEVLGERLATLLNTAGSLSLQTSHESATAVNRQFRQLQLLRRGSLLGAGLVCLAILGMSWLHFRQRRVIARSQRAEAATLESAERLRTIIETTPAGVCFKDGSGRWLEANRQFLVVFGLEGRAVQGLTNAELAEQLSPDGRTLFRRLEREEEEAWLAGSSRTLEGVVDGTSYEFALVPLAGPQGRRRGTVYWCRDVTESRRYEQRLEEQNRELERLQEIFVGRELRIKELRDKLRRNSSGEKENGL